jgi:UDP-2,4-diacetamido-2,4,6-trideoxy-beta-L-altropyranose hydrolase
VTIAADGDPSAGLGHLARCSALASALAERSVAVRALALRAAAPLALDGIEWEPWGPAPPERCGLLVLDTYEDAPPGRPQRLVRIVDGAQAPPDADVAIGLLLDDDGEHRLGGLRHLLLRRAYWQPPPRAVAADARRALVTLGGTDARERGPRIAARLAAAGLAVTLVRGPAAARAPLPRGVEGLDAPPSIADALAAADIAVTAAGQTLWEACALGTPAVATVVADNQRPGAALAALRALAVTVPDGDPDGAAEAALALAADHDRRAALSARAQVAVDGRGAHRVSAALARRP